MHNVEARRLLVASFSAAVAAVDPESAVADSLGPIDGRVAVLALGKAAPAMARGAGRALGQGDLEGIVVSNYEDQIPGGMTLLLGSHPVPDSRSQAAGEALLALARSLGEDDTAVVLISGGGSALAEVPVPGVSIADIATTNELLLRSGADIVATNTVRRRLSLFKGGGLASAVAPARLITLVVSDVVGDGPEVIASGPTVATGDAPGAALEVAAELGIIDDIPSAVRQALDGDRIDREVPAGAVVRIIAGGATAAHAAAAEAERRGVAATVVDTRLIGDAAEATGRVLGTAGGGVSVFAGETTVSVSGDGIGGRNHEAALVAATLIEGRSDIWFLAAGTDGIDGTTRAAGTVVDGGTVARGRAAGLDAGLALERNDSGSYFADLGEQIITGPTGTNVGDIWLVLRD